MGNFAFFNKDKCQLSKRDNSQSEHEASTSTSLSTNFLSCAGLPYTYARLEHHGLLNRVLLLRINSMLFCYE